MKLLPKGRRAILVLGLPIGLAAAGALVFLQMSPSTAATKIPDPEPGQHGVMLALDSRVINLQQAVGATYKYAKIAVTVELRPDDSAFYGLGGEERAKAEKDQLTKRADIVPLLLDALGQVVSSHDAAALNSQNGRPELKKELLAAMRAVVPSDLILDIYFTDFVMQ